MWETSLMMAMMPELVDIEAFPQGLSFLDRCRKYGSIGIDPREHASVEKGHKAREHIVSRLSEAVDEVLEKNSAEPFQQIYDDFDQGMKKVVNLKNGMRTLGATSVLDMARMGIWALGGGKQKLD